MFSICTAFDDAYFKYGYPLCCSIQMHYKTPIFIAGLNLSKKQLKVLSKMPDTVVVNHTAKKNDDYSTRCFNLKVDAASLAFESTDKNVALIDADCLFCGSLDGFEDMFLKDYDLGVHTRWRPESSREWTNFCSHNVFFRNSSAVKKMVGEWKDCLPSWWGRAKKLGYNSNPSYSEQACLWNSYWQNREHVRLLDTQNIGIPILHAKGAKYPGHSLHSEMQYEQKCRDIVEAFVNKGN